MCITGFVLFCGGTAGGIFLSDKIKRRNQSQSKKLKKKLKVIEKEREDLSKELNESQNLLTLNENSQNEKYMLYVELHDHYRQMAAQAHAVNLMTSQLIYQMGDYDEQMHEIYEISENSNAILNPLMKGFPMCAVSENVDIIKSLKKVKDIFLPQLFEMNVKFEINGEIKSPIYLDKTVFEIVLHNIFNLIMTKFFKNSTFQIEIKDNDFVEVHFTDAGYDITNCIQLKSHKAIMDNILCLEKDKLQEFINWLGWTIDFNYDAGSINTIKLAVPRILEYDTDNDNVMNYFDYKPDIK